MSGCPPDLALERYHLGEIAGTASRVWAEHIEGCARCQATLRALADDDERPRAPLHLPTRRAAPRPRLTARVAALSALALVGGAGLLIGLGTGAPHDTWHTKGTGLLSLALEDGSTWRGQPLRPGARAQLTWRGAEAGFLAVVAVEATGAVSVLYPEHDPLAVAVPARAPHVLGGSLVVEARHHRTRLCAWLAPAPYAVDAARVDACRSGQADAVLELEVVP